MRLLGSSIFVLARLKSLLLKQKILLVFVSTLIILSSITTTGSQKLTDNDVRSLLVIPNSTEQLFAVTDSAQTTWVDLGPNNQPIFLFNFSRELVLSKIVNVFSGSAPNNTQIITTLFSEDEKLDEISTGISGRLSIEQHFNLTQKIDRVEMEITTETNTRLLDTFFYESVPVSLLDKLLNFIFNQPRSIVSYFVYSLVFLLSVVSFGFQLAKRFSSIIDKSELVPVSYILGILGFAAIGLVMLRMELIYDVPTKLWQLLFLVWWFYGLRQLMKHIKIEITNTKPLLLAAASLLVITICWTYVYEGSLSKHIQIQNDLYFDDNNRYQASIQPYQSDQVFPYNNAKVLLYGTEQLKGDYDKELASQLLHSRPQLFALFAQPFLRVFGDRFFIFTALSIGLMPMLVFVTYLLSLRIFGSRTALLAAVLIPTNFYLLFLGSLTQIKYLTVVLVAFYYYCVIRTNAGEKKYSVLAAITASLMLMTHYFTIIYLIAGVVYLVIKRELPIRHIVVFSSIPVLLLLVWLIFIGSSSGVGLISTVAAGSDPSAINQLLNRLRSLVGLFSSNPYPEIWERTIGYYKLTLPGMLSVSVFVTLIYWVGRYYYKNKHLILTLLAIPVLVTILGVSDYTLFGIQLYFIGLLPLIYGIAAEAIMGLRRNLRYLLATAIFVEWLYVLTCYYRGDFLLPLIKYGSIYPASAMFIATMMGASVVVIGKTVVELINRDVTST